MRKFLIDNIDILEKDKLLLKDCTEKCYVVLLQQIPPCNDKPLCHKIILYSILSNKVMSSSFSKNESIEKLLNWSPQANVNEYFIEFTRRMGVYIQIGDNFIQIGYKIVIGQNEIDKKCVYKMKEITSNDIIESLKNIALDSHNNELNNIQEEERSQINYDVQSINSWYINEYNEKSEEGQCKTLFKTWQEYLLFRFVPL